MVDTARQLLDELMGRNRNLDPSAQPKKICWDDPDFCQYYLVKFCPHDLFVNTRADLGQCPKLHDDEAKKLYDEARPGARKRQYEDDFLRFCNNMLNEVDRKIQKGRQRLLLMNKGDGSTPAPVYVSKFQEQLNNLNARIKKLVNEAEEAGHRGDVDQAQGLMTLCEQLKDEKESLVRHHEQNVGGQGSSSASDSMPSSPPSGPPPGMAGIPSWAQELNHAQQEKQMEVCEVCGAFLIVGDAQQRIEDHMTGKQHLGYSRLRKAVEEMHERRQKEREDEDRRREEERKARMDNGIDRRRDNRDRDRRSHREYDDRERHRGGRVFSKEYDRRHERDRQYATGRDYRGDRDRGGDRYKKDRTDSGRDRERDRSRRRTRSGSRDGK